MPVVLGVSTTISRLGVGVSHPTPLTVQTWLPAARNFRGKVPICCVRPTIQHRQPLGIRRQGFADCGGLLALLTVTDLPPSLPHPAASLID